MGRSYFWSPAEATNWIAPEGDGSVRGNKAAQKRRVPVFPFLGVVESIALLAQRCVFSWCWVIFKMWFCFCVCAFFWTGKYKEPPKIYPRTSCCILTGEAHWEGGLRLRPAASSARVFGALNPWKLGVGRNRKRVLFILFLCLLIWLFIYFFGGVIWTKSKCLVFWVSLWAICVSVFEAAPTNGWFPFGSP